MSSDDSGPMGAGEGGEGRETGASTTVKNTSVIVVPLVFVEVRPINAMPVDDVDDSSRTESHVRRRGKFGSPGSCSLSSSNVKVQLMRFSSAASGGVAVPGMASSGRLQFVLDDEDSGILEANEAAALQQDRHQAHREGERDDKVHGGNGSRAELNRKVFVSGTLLWGGALGRAEEQRSAAATTATATLTAGASPDSAAFAGRPTLRLESEHPLCHDPIDCYCRGYVQASAIMTGPTIPAKDPKQQPQREAAAAAETHYCVAVTDATLVHLLPPISACLRLSPATGVASLSSHSPAYFASPSSQSFLSMLVGEVADVGGDSDAFNEPVDGEVDDESILECFNPETVRQLTWRLSRMLFAAPKVELGTTKDAVTLQQRHRDRIRRLRLALDSRSTIDAINPRATSIQGAEEEKQLSELKLRSPDLSLEQVLLVHSPNHGEGKTMLVRALLRRLALPPSIASSVTFQSHEDFPTREADEKADDIQRPQRRAAPRIRTHVLQLGPFLAKYGVYADVALETWVHSVAFQAAVRNVDAVCLLVDGMEAIFSPRQPSLADPSTPTLHNMAAYLQSLSSSASLSKESASTRPSLQQPRREIPFPIRNRLYNIGKRGFVASVRFGLVAIATCPDDIFSSKDDFSGARDADRQVQRVASVFAGRYRVPSLTAETRFQAFQNALQRQHLVLSRELDARLPEIAASATWARGRTFDRVAKQLRASIRSRSHSDNRKAIASDSSVSAQDFLVALRFGGRQSTKSPSLLSPSTSSAMLSDVEGAGSSGGGDLFADVGGNQQAKLALEDALALDPVRRHRLASIGMAPPTGIMLVGPPGTGKTLLAKAVAKVLRSTSTTSSQTFGGAFISLSSSDVVRAEVGEGEKMVVSAFETARTNAPAVVFIDEFQALFTDRTSGGSSRMTTALLECMDDVKKWAEVADPRRPSYVRDRGSLSNQDTERSRQGRVVILAATNTPWTVDTAFLRPGRFDRSVQVNLPMQQERYAILRLHICKMRIKFRNEPGSLDAICHNLAAGTEGFSGADLAALCRAAAVRCLLENSDFIEARHLMEAREMDIKASSSAELVVRIQNWKI